MIIRDAPTPRPYTSAMIFGQSVAGGTGSTNGPGGSRLAAARGLGVVSNAVGGSVAHWQTMPLNTPNGNGGYAKALQAITATGKSNPYPPYYPDGLASNILYVVQHGFNGLITSGAESIPADVMAIKTIMSRCLSFQITEATGLLPYSSGGVLFSGSWSAGFGTDRNSGPGWFSTSTVNEYLTSNGGITANAGYPLPPNTVVAFGGWCQSGDTSTITFHDDTAGVTLGTLSLAAAAPPGNTRVLTLPAGTYTYTLSFGGQTTGSLSSTTSTVAAVQTALQGLSSIGTNKATVTGGAPSAGGNTMTLSLGGSLSSTDFTVTVLGTGGAPSISRIASPWIKRFVVGVDIPAYSMNTLRATVTTLGSGQSVNFNYMQYETPIASPVIVPNMFRPPAANTLGYNIGSNTATDRDTAITSFNTALSGLQTEFNRPGLEGQMVYVDIDSALNKLSTFWAWNPYILALAGGVQDNLHPGDDGYAQIYATMENSMAQSMSPAFSNVFQRGRGL